MAEQTPRRRCIRRAVAAWSLLALVGLGCGHVPQAMLTDDAVVAAPVDEVLRERRTTHQALSLHPLAAEMTAELEQAAQWMDRAETMAALDEVDQPRLALVLEVIEGQLTMVKVYYDRRAAEQATTTAGSGGPR